GDEGSARRPGWGGAGLRVGPPQERRITVGCARKFSTTPASQAKALRSRSSGLLRPLRPAVEKTGLHRTQIKPAAPAVYGVRSNRQNGSTLVAVSQRSTR